ncbi:hypothetical protein [Amycolatopsis rifamycinica]|nr:hypothetical protein [Amycolatopsis rifamycinica]
MDQAGQGESAMLTIAGCAGRPDLLCGDEVLDRDESRMRKLGGQCWF